jgi:hypothetical protein
MQPFSRVTILLAFTAAPLAAMAEPSSVSSRAARVGVAESVHVQPRERTFDPNSAEVDAVQKRITIFNAMQRLLDARLDRKLHICRGC